MVPLHRNTSNVDRWHDALSIAPVRAFDCGRPVGFYLRGEGGNVVPRFMIDQKLGGTRQRQAGLHAASLNQPLGDCTDRRRGHQIAGRMIERLNRKRNRLLRAELPHTEIGNAGAHLDEAVKSSAFGPRARPSISV
jgi:hypothetical protein